MDDVRRLLTVLMAACLAFLMSPQGSADFTPWFASQVGNATQVLAVTGTGGSDGKMDVFQRNGSTWQVAQAGIPVKVGEKGLSPDHYDGSMMTPMGVYSLDFAFGTAPNPGGGLQYVQVNSDYWWDGDGDSPTYNLMQVCKQSQCSFKTDPNSGTENLNIPQYKHAVVMGVNKERIPGKGGAFFVHTTDGGPTAGCVALDDDTLVKIMQWLRPGAVIAVTKQA